MITRGGPLMEAAWADFATQVFSPGLALDEQQETRARYLFFAGMSACWTFFNIMHEQNSPALAARLAKEITDYAERESANGGS